MTTRGLERGKFRVSHRTRGELDEGEAFVLVPERDPAALAAIRAYAVATPDAALAADLAAWAQRIDPEPVHEENREVTLRSKVALWVATLAEEVRAGRMDVETALQRIAGHAFSAAATMVTVGSRH